jgi:hypothetical protein
MLASTKTYKFIILIGVVSILLFLVERIYINTMKSIKTGSIGKINAVINHDIDVNVSVWGASTALANFNPQFIEDSLHISALNMGINGSNIDQYNGLLEEYLNYTKKSKFIIIAIDIYGGLEKREQFYELQNWLHHVNNDNIYDCLSDIDYNTIFRARYIPFYSTTLYNKHAFPLFRSAFFNTSSSEYQFTNLGFEPNHSEFNSNITDSNAITVPINLNVFEKLRLTCKSALTKNIKPIVVITPCFYKGLEKIKNKDKFYNLITSLSSEDVIILNFLNTPISYEPEYFKDYTHLNAAGADKLTELVIENIKKLK